jgi:crotonobetainyl-CoA:carnitine CoA-transferase CaiB-like acyl-CoA transferase
MPTALEGMRVVDFSHVFAGPYCTMALADLGADVVKVEPPGGDSTRAFQPPSLGGESPSYLAMNRNKRGIVLDMGDPAAREAARELVLRSDVLVENFASGVMARWGLDHQTLAKVHPRLVYCSISAYGRDGPLAKRAGYDAVIQAETGMMSLNGHADGDPHKTALPFVDLATGMFATQAILAALIARGRTGEGQFIDVPLYDSAVALTSYQMMNFLASGVNPRRIGNHSPVVAPVDLFDAKDGRFFLNIASERVWGKLVSVLGDPPALQAPEFATSAARVKHQDTLLKPLLQAMFATRSLADWLEALRAAGVPAGPVLSIAEAAASPEMRQRGVIGRAPHSTLGEVPNLRLPMHMAGTPLKAPVGAPVLGEHTADVLSDWLGWSPDQAAALAVAARGEA